MPEIVPVFSECPEINGSFPNAHDCPSRTDIKGNSRILNEIHEKLAFLVLHSKSFNFNLFPYEVGSLEHSRNFHLYPDIQKKTARQTPSSPVK